MDRAGALPVGSYALPNSLPVCCRYNRLHNGVYGDGNTGPLVIGTVRPEPPEIHFGNLPASHVDLACQLGL